MIINIILFVIGLALLCYGADWLVKGSSTLAEKFGIKPMVVGLTVVAIGTSAPELVVSVVSVIQKSNDIALGNIIGSNICNIGLVLSIAALIFPLQVQKSLLRKELLIMFASSGLLFYMGSDQIVSRLESAILLLGMLLFTLYLIRSSVKDSKASREDKNGQSEIAGKNASTVKSCIFIAVGLVGLVAGSYMMVKSSVIIAKVMGMSEFTIGLIMVAVGTSLPELATSISAAIRKESDILIGNVIGSNICNVLLVIGTVGIIQPLAVDPGILRIQFPVMMIFSAMLYPFLRSGFVLERIEGLVLLLGYVLFVSYSFG